MKGIRVFCTLWLREATCGAALLGRGQTINVGRPLIS